MTTVRVDCSQPVPRERRRLRNGLLAASDWTQLPDAPLTEGERAEWARYRQHLRDNPLGPWSSPPNKETS